MKKILSFAVCLPFLLVNFLQAEEPRFIDFATVNGSEEAAQFVTFSPDGKKVVTTNQQQIAKIWDVDTGSASFGKAILTLDASVDGIKSIRHINVYATKLIAGALSSDGKKFVASGDKIVRIWDIDSDSTYFGKEIQKFEGHGDIVVSVAFSPDDKKIVTASWDGTARIWDVESGRELQKLVQLGGPNPRLIGEHPSLGNSAVFSPDGKKILTHTHTENIVRIWDAETGKIIQELQGNAGRVIYSAVLPDGDVRVWDADAGKVVQQDLKGYGHTGRIMYSAFSPDGKKIITIGYSNYECTLRIWDAESGEELHKFEKIPASFRFYRYTPVSPDGKKIVTAADVIGARLWDAESGNELQTLGEDGRRIFSAAFSPDGKTIVTMADSYLIRIWDVESGKSLQTLEGPNIFFALFSPDGKKIAVSSGDTHHGINSATRIWFLE